MKHGDFTSLAKNYNLYRPGYSDNVVKVLKGIIGKNEKRIRAVDLAAGTGIFTKCLIKNKIINCTG